MKKTNRDDEATLALGSSEDAENTTPARGGEVVRVELSDNTIERLAAAMAEHLGRMMPLHARLCAADTIRTSERTDTVFRHAIKEAFIAQGEIDKHFQAATVAV